MSRIIRNLYLGDVKDSHNHYNLYDVIVNCTSKKETFPRRISTYELEVEDNGTPGQDEILYDLLKNEGLFRRLYNHLRRGERILIHCHMGKQRSAATVACFLLFLWSYGEIDFTKEIKRPQDVINFIQRKRIIAFTNTVHFNGTISRYFRQARKRRDQRMI